MKRQIANYLVGLYFLSAVSYSHAANCHNPQSSEEIAEFLGKDLRVAG